MEPALTAHEGKQAFVGVAVLGGEVMAEYDKPWLSYRDQLQQLKDRGLTITDEHRALAHLERIGYYRLSGYWYAFRQRSNVCCPLDRRGRPAIKKGKTDYLALDTFKPGATF